VKRLRECDRFKIKFVTNTTTSPKSIIHKNLNSLGLRIDKNELFTSLIAARKLVEESQLRPMLFLEEEALEDFEGY
jgi:ribonucleotide monophosphatase NagD (HAD superfamily)